MGSTTVMRDIEGAIRGGFNVAFGNIPITTVPGTLYILTKDDNQRVVLTTSGTATGIVVPKSMPIGWSCIIVQGGAGTVTVAGASGVTLVNRASEFDTAGANAVISLLVTSKDNVVMAGDTA